MRKSKQPICGEIRRIIFDQLYSSQMNRYKTDASMTISRQISDYLVNRARQIYVERVKTEAIKERSIKDSLVFPQECAEKIISLDKLQPNFQNFANLKEQYQLSPPQTMKDFHRSARMTHNPARLSKFTTRTNSIAYSKTIKQNISATSQEFHKKCLPLSLAAQEGDLEIQNLRVKKQKMYDLQQYFISSEKEEKRKTKPTATETINHLNYTTDFNGDKIEVKAVHYRKQADPYSLVTMTPTIRQERQENKYFLTSDQLKEYATNRHKKENSLSVAKNNLTNKSKSSKQSGTFESFTLKEIQNFMKRDNRRKKQAFVNRNSRVRLPQLLNIMHQL